MPLRITWPELYAWFLMIRVLQKSWSQSCMHWARLRIHELSPSRSLMGVDHSHSRSPAAPVPAGPEMITFAMSVGLAAAVICA